MKPLYLITNSVPPQYYVAYQEKKTMKLKTVKHDERGIPIGSLNLQNIAPVKEAIQKIKKWVKNGKGRIIRPEERVLIPEFDFFNT